ncbi:MAG TPA: FAD-dependent oxidoreductase, partial [Prosthecobacter sp.]|nr:FAD-dependent oxidoreductase [Prosthecobacter sp.]
LYFIANDPRVPKDVQDEMKAWGLPKDEFKDNGNWSHQLYIREARRMIGKYVMTENELRKKKPTPESVGMGSYTIDSHNVQRYITPEGHVQNEGDIGVSTNGPYEISYGSLVPKEGQGENLLVPVAMSASHIAYGSIRMEPVFMILGQSAATAAVFAIEDGVPVQKVSYPKLRERLLKDGQVLEYKGPPTAKSVMLEGTVVDDEQAIKTGDWVGGGAAKKFIGYGYSHDGNAGKGEKTITFRATLPKAGRYEVRLAYAANNNRCGAVPVIIRHAGGEATTTVDQKKPGPIDGLAVSLGTFEFDAAKPAEVLVSNEGTMGYVVADAVQWVAK